MTPAQKTFIFSSAQFNAAATDVPCYIGLNGDPQLAEFAGGDQSRIHFELADGTIVPQSISYLPILTRDAIWDHNGQSPAARYVGNGVDRTFFIIKKHRGQRFYAGQYDHIDGSWKEISLNSVVGLDDKVSGAIAIHPDGTVFFAIDGGTSPEIVLLRSDNPGDISDTVTLSSPTITNVLRPKLVFAGNTLYMFYQNAAGEWLYTYTEDKGSTWSAIATIIDAAPGSGHMHLCSDGVDKIHIVYSIGDISVTAGTNDILHAYLQHSNHSLYTSAGSLIGASPATSLDEANGTMVIDASVNSMRYKTSGITLDASDRPVVGVTEYNDRDNVRAVQARFNGSVWSSELVFNSGRSLNSFKTTDDYVLSEIWQTADPDVMLIARTGDDRTQEIRRYQKVASSWIFKTIVSGQGPRKIRPFDVLNAHPDLQIVYLGGDFVNGTSGGDNVHLCSYPNVARFGDLDAYINLTFTGSANVTVVMKIGNANSTFTVPASAAARRFIGDISQQRLLTQAEMVSSFNNLGSLTFAARIKSSTTQTATNIAIASNWGSDPASRDFEFGIVNATDRPYLDLQLSGSASAYSLVGSDLTAASESDNGIVASLGSNVMRIAANGVLSATTLATAGLLEPSSGTPADVMSGVAPDALTDIYLGSADFLAVYATAQSPDWVRLASKALKGDGYDEYEYVLTSNNSPYSISNERTTGDFCVAWAEDSKSRFVSTADIISPGSDDFIVTWDFNDSFLDGAASLTSMTGSGGDLWGFGLPSDPDNILYVNYVPSTQTLSVVYRTTGVQRAIASVVANGDFYGSKRAFLRIVGNDITIGLLECDDDGLYSINSSTVTSSQAIDFDLYYGPTSKVTLGARHATSTISSSMAVGGWTAITMGEFAVSDIGLDATTGLINLLTNPGAFIDRYEDKINDYVSLDLVDVNNDRRMLRHRANLVATDKLVDINDPTREFVYTQLSSPTGIGLGYPAYSPAVTRSLMADDPASGSGGIRVNDVIAVAEIFGGPSGSQHTYLSFFDVITGEKIRQSVPCIAASTYIPDGLSVTENLAGDIAMGSISDQNHATSVAYNHDSGQFGVLTTYSSSFISDNPSSGDITNQTGFITTYSDMQGCTSKSLSDGLLLYRTRSGVLAYDGGAYYASVQYGTGATARWAVVRYDGVNAPVTKFITVAASSSQMDEIRPASITKIGDDLLLFTANMPISATKGNWGVASFILNTNNFSSTSTGWWDGRTGINITRRLESILHERKGLYTIPHSSRQIIDEFSDFGVDLNDANLTTDISLVNDGVVTANADGVDYVGYICIHTQDPSRDSVSPFDPGDLVRDKYTIELHKVVNFGSPMLEHQASIDLTPIIKSAAPSNNSHTDYGGEDWQFANIVVINGDDETLTIAVTRTDGDDIEAKWKGSHVVNAASSFSIIEIDDWTTGTPNYRLSQRTARAEDVMSVTSQIRNVRNGDGAYLVEHSPASTAFDTAFRNSVFTKAANVSDLQTLLSNSVQSATSSAAVESKLDQILLSLTGATTKIDAVNAQTNSNSAAISNVDGDIAAVATSIASLQTSVNTVGINVSQALVDVANVDSDVAAVQASVNSVVSAISSLDGDLTTVDGKIDTLQTSVTAVGVTATANAAALATNATATTAQTTTLNTIATNVSGVATSVGNVQAAVAGVDTKVTNNTTTLGTVNTTTTTINNKSTSILNDLSDIATEVAIVTNNQQTLVSLVTTVDNVVDAINVKATTIQTTTSATSTNVTNLVSAVANVDADVAAVYAELAQIGGSVTSSQTLITSINNRTMTINNQATTIDGKIDTLTTNIATVNTTVGSTSAAIAGLATQNNVIITDIAAVETLSNQIITDIGAIDFGTIGTDVQDLGIQITDLATDVSSLSSLASSISGSVTTLGTSLDATDGVVDASKAILDQFQFNVDNTLRVDVRSIDGLATWYGKSWDEVIGDAHDVLRGNTVRVGEIDTIKRPNNDNAFTVTDVGVGRTYNVI